MQGGEREHECMHADAANNNCYTLIIILVIYSSFHCHLTIALPVCGRSVSKISYGSLEVSEDNGQQIISSSCMRCILEFFSTSFFLSIPSVSLCPFIQPSTLHFPFMCFLLSVLDRGGEGYRSERVWFYSFVSLFYHVFSCICLPEKVFFIHFKLLISSLSLGVQLFYGRHIVQSFNIFVFPHA